MFRIAITFVLGSFDLPSFKLQYSYPFIIIIIIIVVSCAVPVGNVSWMLFHEGQSSDRSLRRGVGQAVQTRNKPHVKCNAVYCA